MIVFCEVCKGPFPVKVHKRVMSLFPRVVKTYLKCPSCGATYTCGYYDKKIQHMIDSKVSKEEIISYQKELEKKYGTPFHS